MAIEKIYLQRHCVARSHSQSNRALRKHCSGLTVGLNFTQLEQFLRQIIVSGYCEDRHLAMLAATEFSGLARRCEDEPNCATDLSNVESFLDSFLGSSPRLPANLVFEAHSQMGLIRSALHHNSIAIESFLKALWIASQTEDMRQESLALTLHRLGDAYAAKGDYQQAQTLLRNAVTTYEKSFMKFDHPCIVQAKKSLLTCEAKQQEKSWSILQTAEKNAATEMTRRLPNIYEDDEEEEADA